MHSRVTAALSLFGLAAVGLWLRNHLRKRPPTVREDLPVESTPPPAPDVIDDDAAAEIIRRAQPALERARRFV
jgi:hypothetical protein